jgi:Reverse transcriptase (RNA-dependent DNA polymerase)
MKLIPTFRVNAGLRHNVLATSAIVYSIGDSVYTYSEMPGVRTGTHRIVGFDGQAILVDVGTMLTSLKVSHLKSSRIPLRIMWTGVLTPSDPRVGSPEMTIAMKDELDQLFARGTFKIVILRDPRHKNIHPTKLIWTIKHEDGREVYKVRFVIRGHRDRWKDQLVLTATSLWQTSVRLLLAMASIFDWPIWTTDARRAYLQSASLSRRAVFLNPNEISIGKDEVLQLMVPLYGLGESGDYWSKTLADHCLDDCHLSNVQPTCLSFSRGKGGNWWVSHPHMSTTFCGLLLMGFAPSWKKNCDQGFIASHLKTCRPGFAASIC